MSAHDGGPAFPCEGGDMSGLIADPGMSLRDWFAGQALSGEMVAGDRGWHRDNFGLLASRCYAAADALLAERAKGGAP